MMNAKRPTVRAAVSVIFLLTLLCTTTSAEIPALLNYQVMLTDDADQPLADQSVVMAFRIFDVESGGAALWTETHNPTTNSIGVVSVILGSITPIGFDFDQPLWLEVEVDGETLSPRRTLTAAPYAGHAAEADDSEQLGGIDASEYAMLTDLTGIGDGHSLDADDGSPADAVYVDGDGKVGIGTTSPTYDLHVMGSARLQDYGVGVTGLWIVAGDPSYTGVELTAQDDYGGTALVNHRNGFTAVGIGATSYAGGGGLLQVARNDAGSQAFVVDGSYVGSSEPRMAISGTTDDIVFDLRQSGSDIVQLPDDSIGAIEILDEPGVANIQTGNYASVSGSVMAVAARHISAPAPGFVYVSATAVVEFDNRTNQGHYVELGLSELQAAFSSHAQEFIVSIPGGVYGHYYETVTVTGMFEVGEGSHTFYLNVRELAGECRIGPRHFNVLYFPTAHGATDFTE